MDTVPALDHCVVFCDNSARISSLLPSRILNEIVHKIPAFEDRKDQKELQEVTQRLVEACNTIAGSSLEQSTWLRRNVSVKINTQEQTVTQTDGEWHADLHLISSVDV